jgi:Tol biopolymer transport system component
MVSIKKRALALFGLLILAAGGLLSACGQKTSDIEPSATTFAEPTRNLARTEVTPTGENMAPPSCKLIVFVLSDYQAGIQPDIYSVCPDGSNLTRLTDDPAADYAPAWSPDGARLAFASSRSGNSQIYVMSANGSGVSQLTSDDQNDLPIWLPDGMHIAFRTTDGKGFWWWRIIDLGSHEIHQLSEPSYDFFYQTPAWSPDGLYLAYMSLEEQKERNDGSSQIHVRSVDGSGDIALTHDIWANISPTWSPDSSQIAFLSERDGTYNSFALYVMNSDGSSVRRLTEPLYSEDVSLAWSPDGKTIALDSSGLAMRNIYLVDVNTGKQHILLDLPEGQSISDPTWQP